MRSPGSAQLALDSAGTMVNCTVKPEGKKDACPEAPPGPATAAAAATSEAQPGDPAQVALEGSDPQAATQVLNPFLGLLSTSPPLALTSTPYATVSA